MVGTTNVPVAHDGKVHLNRATQSELEDLPGVGPVLAARLIQYREEKGGFRNLSALDSVAGVGPSMLSNLKDLVAFD
jgi:competence protein ComEA